jgi:hypothetical protein
MRRVKHGQIALAGCGGGERAEDMKVSAKRPTYRLVEQSIMFRSCRGFLSAELLPSIPVSSNVSISSTQDVTNPIPKEVLAHFLESLGRAG